MKHQQLNQWARTGIAAALMCTASSLALAEVGNPRVNQVGYLPNGAKIATYVTDSAAAEPWELRLNGEVVASGNTVPLGSDAGSGDNVHQISLGDITQEASGYTLHVGDDESYPFDIDADSFRGALYDSIKYFYHNRSGIEIETQYTGGGNTSYQSDSQWARPAGHLNEGANQGDYDVPCWSGTCNYSLDVIKGWYDAGDHGKYVVNGGISVWKLLNMYERALHLSDSADRFADGTLNIPESGNGVPDILDEVRWQMEFMMAMQVPEGESKAGMAHHKMHDVGWTGLPLAPHEDSQERALVPPSVTATLNLAATAAQCARLWESVDSDFANQCLTSAERAWDAAQQNPDDIYSGNYNNGGGGYGDADPSDEFYWAAAELYITTGDNRYLPTIENYLVERTDWAWPDTELAGLMSLAVVPTSHTGSLREQAQSQVVEIADGHRATIDSTGYRIPTTDEEYYWGSNNVLANKLFLLGLAHDFTGDDAYAQAFGTALDYLFGRNTLSFSYVSGHGDDALTEPHHRFWAGALNGSYPWLPPGALSGGPNDGLEDDVSRAALDGCQAQPATCYLDDIEAWSTNEITINWNSALAWVLAFHHDYAATEETSNNDPVASLSVTPESGMAPLEVSFNAGDSSDPDGDSLSYSWEFGDGATASGVTANHTYTEADSYTAQVTVTDGRGGSDTASQVIEVISQISSSSSSSSSVSSSSSSSSVSSSSSSSVSGGQQCNWYGTLYPLCESTQSGWGWEDSQSCIAPSTCEGQPDPYGIVGDESSSSSSSLSSSSSTESSSSSSSSVAVGGNCEYQITNEWSSGYTGAIVISNEGGSAINGWSVNWEYSDGSSLTNSWNAQVSGSNPYSASDMGWNGTIQPGQSVEFGFQVSKGSGSAQTPDVSGSVCD